jgi:hypothetical protein
MVSATERSFFWLDYFPEWLMGLAAADCTKKKSLGASSDPKGGDLDGCSLEMVILRMMLLMFFARPAV